MTRSFPPAFDWVTATAAHQIEGGNWNNDWWAWEHDADSGCAEPSGDACDSWNRWPDDVALVSSLGLGSYRFSIEWSRIEPEEGEWSRAAVDHYDLVLLDLPPGTEDVEGLLRSAAGAVAHGGRLVVSGRLPQPELEQALTEACAALQRAAVRIARPGLPADFPSELGGAELSRASLALELL